MYDIAKEKATEIREVLFNDGKAIRVLDEHGWRGSRCLLQLTLKQLMGSQ